jgi:two-component system sensor histidine kinase MprB
MSLRTRLAASTGLAVAVVVLALVFGVYAAAKAELRGQIDSALKDRARQVIDQPYHPPGGGSGDHDNPFGRPPPGPPGGADGIFQFISPTGQVEALPGQTSTLPASSRAKQIASSGQGSFFSDVTYKGQHLRVYTVGSQHGALQVARSLGEVDSSLRRLLAVLIGLGIAGVILAVALGAIVAKTALRPIRRFTARTEAIVDDPDLSHRLPEQGRDELTRLAHSFNGALTALESSVESQRQLVADASHELRTPIASLRANVQILEEEERLPEAERAGLRADIVSELDELTSLVGDIAELARGSTATEVDDDVRLDLIASGLVERFERRMGDAVRFECSLQETVMRGDGERIARAVSNLLDNACKWTPPSGVVEVALADGWLTVRDHGPGFEDEDLPHVFDRFYRASAARGKPGSGLGLAIVRQAAESGGGSVHAEHARGGGALVRIRFDPESG